VKLTTKMKSVYVNKEPLTDKDMEMSRNISIFEGCTARTIFTLTSGAFLVGFAKYIGASDQIAGIIAAIPVLAGIIMVFSPLVFERMENRKFISCLFFFIGWLMICAKNDGAVQSYFFGTEYRKPPDSLCFI